MRCADGERVMAGTHSAATPRRSWCRAADAIPLRRRLTFEQGAAIPVNYATAWAALSATARCARARRCSSRPPPAASASRRRSSPSASAPRSRAPPRPASTTRSAPTASTTPSTTASDSWWEGLPQFDVILDAIGGRQFKRSYALLRAGGRLVAFGASSVPAGREAQLAPRASRSAADDAGLRPHRADAGVEGRHRPEHADACGTTAGHWSRGSPR